MFYVFVHYGYLRVFFFFSSRRRHTRFDCDWSSDVCSSDLLARGDFGRLASDGQTTVARGVDVAQILGWTEGRLAFERTPLPEVLAELDRWFDRDFVLGDSSLVRLRLTTSLRGESLGEAIAVLEAALSVHARVVGRTVILRRHAV